MIGTFLELFPKHLVGWFFSACYILFIPLSSKTFALLHRMPIRMGGLHNSSRLYYAAPAINYLGYFLNEKDREVVPKGLSGLDVGTVAAFLVIYPFGMTAMFALLLLFHRKKIQSRAEDKIRYIRDLYIAYEPKFWWYEIAESVRRLGFAGLFMFITNDLDKEILVDGSTQNPIPLCIGLAWCFIFALLQALLQPYSSDDDNHLAVLSSAHLFLLLFISTLQQLKNSEWYTPEVDTLLDSVLVISTVVFLLSLVIQPLRNVYITYMKQKKSVGGSTSGGGNSGSSSRHQAMRVNRAGSGDSNVPEELSVAPMRTLRSRVVV
jgi:hypothetical protein